jgi:hypothetical protein
MASSSVLLVTAHPDDEAMFFAPSIGHFVGAGASVSLLCLSTGAGADPSRPCGTANTHTTAEYSTPPPQPIRRRRRPGARAGEGAPRRVRRAAGARRVRGSRRARQDRPLPDTPRPASPLRPPTRSRQSACRCWTTRSCGTGWTRPGQRPRWRRSSRRRCAPADATWCAPNPPWRRRGWRSKMGRGLSPTTSGAQPRPRARGAEAAGADL